MKLRLLLLISLSIAAFSFMYYEELQEFTLKVRKYTQLNIPKNNGIHKLALEAIDVIASKFFTINSVEEIEVTAQVYDFLNKLSYKQTAPIFYDESVIEVNNTEALLEALTYAEPGNTIFLMPGEYRVDSRGKRLRTFINGTKSAPIIITANPNTATILSSITKAITIKHSYWQVQNIEFRGDCDIDKRCDHAIHVVGALDGIILEKNIFKNFNAHIKANGQIKGDKKMFPKNGVIANNVFHNEWVRDVKASVTPIDIVGGANWRIDGNFIADFSRLRKKGQEIGYAYGLFLKGASTNGIVENNLVICEWKVKSYSQIDSRIGISLGGGGTGKSLCEVDGCEFEHQGGVIKNNTIMNCPNDVGIYLNKASESRVFSNVIVGTLGIDSRYGTSSGVIYDNVYQGRLKNRDEASVIYKNNSKFNGSL